MVKISDVAKLAQVSEATVSRVLSGDMSFSASDLTRKKVFDAVAQLGYKSNRQRKPKSGEPAVTLNIGLLTASQEDEINDPYYLSIRLGIEKQCAAMSLNLKSTIRLNAPLSNLDFAGLDGLVVVGSIDPEPLRQLYIENDNIVFVNNLYKHDPDYDAILSDLTNATEDCIDILYNLGHRSIGYIGGNEIIHNVATHQNQVCKDIRHKTFEEKMKQLGLFNPDHVYICNWSASEGQRAAQEAIRKGKLPTAFLVGSDPLSMGVIHAFREAGIRVPEDVSIISFDDIEAAAFLNPPLSSVRMFTEEIGRQSVKTLYDRLLGRDIVINVVVPSKLAVRQSYTTPRKEA